MYLPGLWSPPVPTQNKVALQDAGLQCHPVGSATPRAPRQGPGLCCPGSGCLQLLTDGPGTHKNIKMQAGIPASLRMQCSLTGITSLIQILSAKVKHLLSLQVSLEGPRGRTLIKLSPDVTTLCTHWARGLRRKGSSPPSYSCRSARARLKGSTNPPYPAVFGTFLSPPTCTTPMHVLRQKIPFLWYFNIF